MYKCGKTNSSEANLINANVLHVPPNPKHPSPQTSSVAAPFISFVV